jgi:hypothetical protein
MGGCAGQLNSAYFGQEVEEMGLKLKSLVGGDGLRATEKGYPGGRGESVDVARALREAGRKRGCHPSKR